MFFLIARLGKVYFFLSIPRLKYYSLIFFVQNIDSIFTIWYLKTVQVKGGKQEENVNGCFINKPTWWILSVSHPRIKPSPGSGPLRRHGKQDHAKLASLSPHRVGQQNVRTRICVNSITVSSKYEGVLNCTKSQAVLFPWAFKRVIWISPHSDFLHRGIIRSW